MLSVVLDPSKNHSCWILYLCHQAKVVVVLFCFCFSGQGLLRQLQDPSS